MAKLVSRRSFVAGTAAAGAVVVGGINLFPAVYAQDATPIPYEAPDNIGDLSGDIEIDGSSTLGPLTEAAIEEFAAVAPNIRITNGISGSGSGFERLTTGEIPISNASRQISDDEIVQAQENGISWYRFDMAVDGITVVVSVENDFIQDLTVEQLAQIWQEGGATTWDQVNPEWPAEAIELYGPGTASGTYDYFNEEVLGEELAPRQDYVPSEDDNVLVQGVAGSPYALGYFGFSYYEENTDTLRAVTINGVAPSIETISGGEYTPLGRSLYIYANAAELQGRPEVAEFAKFYAAISGEIAPSVGYIALPGPSQLETQLKVQGAIDGSLAPDSDTVATPAA